jgi:TonB family protein
VKKPRVLFKQLGVCVLMSAPALTLAGPPQAPSLNKAVQEWRAFIVRLTGADNKGQAVPPGAGFIVRKGVVATSYDFVKDAVTIDAQLPGQEARPARMLAVDKGANVALLTLDTDGAQSLPPLTLMWSPKLSVGDRVYIVGSPESSAAGSRRASAGKLVTVRGRQYISIDSDGAQPTRGSPILDESGRLAGILGVTTDDGVTAAFIVPTVSISSLVFPLRGEAGGIALSGVRPPSTRNEAVQKASASVVRLTGADNKGQAVPPGAGFIVSKGIVATSYDFVKDVVAIDAQLPGQEARPAEVFAVDKDRSVALLTLDTDGVQSLPLLMLMGNPNFKLSIGDRVYIVGSAESSSALSRQATIGKLVTVRGSQYISIDSDGAQATNGSPVFDEFGSIAGILGVTTDDVPSVAFVVPALSILSLMFPPRPEAAPKIIRMSTTALEAKAILRVEPNYPPAARAAGVSGWVVVEITIDEEGHVIQATAVSGHQLLKDSAVTAAMGWRFMPTKFSGGPVKVIGTITFIFPMGPKNPHPSNLY